MACVASECCRDDRVQGQWWADGSGGECDLVSEVCGEAASLDELLCVGDLLMRVWSW